jgi:hypothetical protein
VIDDEGNGYPHFTQSRIAANFLPISGGLDRRGRGIKSG